MPTPETQRVKSVEEVAKDCFPEYSEITTYDIEVQLTQDRTAIHTSLVEAVEGLELTKKVMHDHVYTLAVLKEEIEKKKKQLFDNPLKNSQAEQSNRDRSNYNQALDDTLTIINSIFKE